MKKKLAIFLISTLFITNSAYADFGFDTAEDYTGEAFFEPADSVQNRSFVQAPEGEKKDKHTIPPIKQIRLKIQDHQSKSEAKRYELAPTASDIYEGEIETSKYSSQEVEENFEEMVAPDGFDADEEAIQESEKPKKRLFKKKKQTPQEGSEDIILDCDNVSYDTEKSLVYATGNVDVEFVKQGIKVKADTITFDRISNTVKAEGNIKIL